MDGIIRLQAVLIVQVQVRIPRPGGRKGKGTLRHSIRRGNLRNIPATSTFPRCPPLFRQLPKHNHTIHLSHIFFAAQNPLFYKQKRHPLCQTRTFIKLLINFSCKFSFPILLYALVVDDIEFPDQSNFQIPSYLPMLHLVHLTYHLLSHLFLENV